MNLTKAYMIATTNLILKRLFYKSLDSFRIEFSNARFDRIAKFKQFEFIRGLIDSLPHVPVSSPEPVPKV